MTEVVVLERARARVGTSLAGKYRLDRLLGVGGMASVYAATHRNNKRVAVKVLHAELSIHADLRQRFMREGYVANTVDHPGAVAVLDDDVTDDGAAFLVMELLEGATLADVADRMGGRLPLRAVLAAADQILEVLAAADAHHIVHRDIKPANLFLTVSGHMKVLDFGVARLRDVHGQHTTHSGIALGTPAFMAPEQAMGRSEDVGGRTDLWALGATIFGLLTGRAVHEASSGQQQMVYAATRSAESLASIDPAMPASVVAIVDRSLAFHPHARWESANAMRRAVREAHQTLFGEEPSVSGLAAVAESVRAMGDGSAARGAASPAAQHSPHALDPTFPATPVDSGVPRRGAQRQPSASGHAPAVSLAGTLSQPRVTPMSRARVVFAAALLVVCGALFGAWAAARGRASPSLAVAASTGTSLLAPSVPPPSSTNMSPPPSASAPGIPLQTGSAARTNASSALSASALKAPPPSSSPVRSRPGSPGEPPNARNRAQARGPETPSPPDQFDHQ